MNLSELICFQSNWQRLIKIKENRKNIVPFVGAGISKGCGLYTWRELLHQLAIDFLNADDIQKAEAKGDVFAYADQIVDATGNPDMIMRRVHELFLQRKVSMTEMPYLLVSMFSPMIITTNYDTLLEDASSYSPLGPVKPLLPCLIGQMNEAIQINGRKLLKIHGSVEETQSFVFTSKQYRKFYGKKNNRKNRLLPAYLMKIFTGKKVLFVGCSLEQDYTLEILEECVRRNPNISHYAIIACPSEPDKLITRNRELAKLGIEPIYYPEGDFRAVNKLLHFIAEENPFILSMKQIVKENLEECVINAFQVQILLSVLKGSYYKTAIRFPSLLDLEELKADYNEITMAFLESFSGQENTILDICKNAFAKYVESGYLHYSKEVINYFTEQFEDGVLKENIIEPMLKKNWFIKHRFNNAVNDDLLWIKKVSEEKINFFAEDVLQKLQYANGMSYDIYHTYCVAKKIIELVEDRVNFKTRIRLLNSIGAFGYRFQDSQTAIAYLEKAIKIIDACKDNDRELMLLQAKCYANLAITKGYSNVDLKPALEAAEKDILLKRKYNESSLLYCRSLNVYATILKEIDPFKACDIYFEVADIKKKLICYRRDSEHTRELIASWATTIFNIGLVAKDLELYDIAYRIVKYANQYRFATVDYCNPDYCSSINVFAELELFVKEKYNIQWLVSSVESRVDLPEGFIKTLSHTWYVCAWYYYIKKDYFTAIRYINKSIEVSREQGALVDFRQNMRTKLLLANIKYAQSRNKHDMFKEAISIIIDIIKQINDLYGVDSYYLLLPCRHLMQMVEKKEDKEKYGNQYFELFNKYKPAIKITEEKLKTYIVEHLDE